MNGYDRPAIPSVHPERFVHLHGSSFSSSPVNCAGNVAIDTDALQPFYILPARFYAHVQVHKSDTQTRTAYAIGTAYKFVYVYFYPLVITALDHRFQGVVQDEETEKIKAKTKEREINKTNVVKVHTSPG